MYPHFDRRNRLFIMRYHPPLISMRFSGQRCLLVAGSAADHYPTYSVWDLVMGDTLQMLEGHTALVSYVTFSPDAAHLASSSWDGTMHIWDAVSGQSLQVL